MDEHSQKMDFCGFGTNTEKGVAGTELNPGVLGDLALEKEGEKSRAETCVENGSADPSHVNVNEAQKTGFSVGELQLLQAWTFGKATKTKISYLAVIRDLLSYTHPKQIGDISEQDLKEFLSLKSYQAPDTKKQRTAILRSFFKYLTRKRIIAFDPALDLPTVKTHDKLNERYLSEEEMIKMITSTQKLRDRVILKVLYSGGVRVSELVSLNWGAVSPRENGGGQITVIGKRDKKRSILLSPGTFTELMTLKRESARDFDPVFLSQRGRLSVRMVQVIVDQARLRAGIVRRVSPHWVRHAHASHALDKNAPLHLIMSTLGHASVATTSKYLHSRPQESSGTFLAI
jgi:integrase/recombinase XerD